MVIRTILPQGWKKAKLGEYFRIKHGFAFKGEFFADEGPYILLTPGNFNPDGGIKLKGEKEKYYTGDFPSEFLLKRGDFLIVLTDLIQNAPILGSPAFVKGDNKFLHNQRLGKITDLNDSKIYPLFLYYLFNSTKVRDQIKASATGATVKHTAPERIYAVEVELPPISTQHKIAAILSAYDNLIENNTRRIAILEEMAHSLYREWFVEFRFPGHEEKRMVESALGMIPEGWEVVKLVDVAQEIRRSINPELIDPETPYFGLEHLPRRSIALANWGTAKEVQSTKLAFKKGEILFGKIRPYFHKVGVAPLDGVCSSDTIVISSRAKENFGLVLCCVSSNEFVNYATRTSQGTKMPRANWDVLVGYPVVIPSKQILLHFNTFLQDVVYQIQNLTFRNRNLRHTRDLLLPKLISGEVDVEVIEKELVKAEK
jgi:type I restriction enzyme, S subunit